MSSYEINGQKLSSKELKSRFDLYGRFSVCSVDMNKPEVIKINEKPAEWCSNSFVKINLKEDGFLHHPLSLQEFQIEVKLCQYYRPGLYIFQILFLFY